MSHRDRPLLSGLPTTCDVAIIGAGLAGAAAGIFAGRAKLDTVQIGPMGGVLFTSGPFDLLAVHPVAEGRVWDDPWAALAALRRDEPDNPLGRVSDDDYRGAFDAIRSALSDAGLDYDVAEGGNTAVPTSMGTVRSAFALPRPMATAAAALADGRPGLIVGFDGLREFSASQVVATLGERWPALRAVRVPFPSYVDRTETYLAHMARVLESQEGRAALAELIRPHLGDARVVGLPAVLGVRRTRSVHEDLEARLGVPVFELPTLPTSVPGLRLEAALEAALADLRVQRLVRWRVLDVALSDDGIELGLGREAVEHRLRARALVLATGRFTGRGLVAGRDRIREPLLDLPVAQPASRADWHRHHFLDPEGHAVNRAGLRVDDHFRPLGPDGQPVHERLFAVGSVLAGQDWVRSKSGAGLAFGTSRVAVRAAAVALRGEG